MTSGSAPDQPAAATAPWPPREGESPFAAFAQAWRDATFDPGSYRRLGTGVGLGPGLAYYLVVVVLVAGIDLFWTNIFTATGLAQPSVMGELGIAPDPTGAIVGFLLSPLYGLILLFAAAGVTHLMLLLIQGAEHGFATTARVFCFAYSPQVFHAVPVIGPLVGYVWMVVIGILGLREAHRTDGWRAGLAVLVPLGLGILVSMAAFMLALATGQISR